MTTVHAYTDDQSLVDALHKDPRRARGAAINIVPTTTGAARATGLVLPSVAGHLDGLALRVPSPRRLDHRFRRNAARDAERRGDQRRLSAARRVAGRLAGLLEFSDEPLVSSDIVNSTASCVFDSGLTMAQGHLVKVLGWYDNETGYSSRLADLASLVGATERQVIEARVFQIRFHGRGGQGVVTAAEMLSVAAFAEGKFSQAFPSFGSERTGAPVVSFCRIDELPIRSREPVHPARRPDHPGRDPAPSGRRLRRSLDGGLRADQHVEELRRTGFGRVPEHVPPRALAHLSGHGTGA